MSITRFKDVWKPEVSIHAVVLSFTVLIIGP